MKKRLLASLLITSVNPTLLYAQTDLAQTPADLPEMVVTATRSEVPITALYGIAGLALIKLIKTATVTQDSRNTAS